MFPYCDFTSAPKVYGVEELETFSPALIDSDRISIKSSSTKLGETKVDLIVEFKPVTVLKAKGIIQLHVPEWYIIDDLDPQKPILSTESMLGIQSVPVFNSHVLKGFNITKYDFLPGSRTIFIEYSGPEDSTDNVKITFSNFKNPVNNKVKTGFTISTLDTLGYVIDASNEQLALETKMDTPRQLRSKELYLLGDADGENVGRVGTYNRVMIEIVSPLPLEKNCWFKFQFPYLLQIDSALELVKGAGIF